VVGLVHVLLYDTPSSPLLRPCRRGHIEDLVVHPKHRRRGTGRRLMAAAAEWARERGATEMVLTVWTGNARAARFYRALGYTEASRVLRKPV
jgi:ribosomal protein S18 acetylase RimI-like enzyme